MVLVGHCTWNDWALAATVARPTRRIGNQTWYGFLENMRPPQISLARGSLLLVCSWDHGKWLNHFSTELLICRTPRCRAVPQTAHRTARWVMTPTRLREADLACAEISQGDWFQETWGLAPQPFFF